MFGALFIGMAGIGIALRPAHEDEDEVVGKRLKKIAREKPPVAR